MKAFIHLSLLLITSPVCQNLVFADNPTLHEIVTAVQNNLKRPPVAMQIETETYKVDPNGIEPPIILQAEKTQYYKNGHQVDITTRRHALNEEGKLVFDNFWTRYFSSDSCSFFRQNDFFYIRTFQSIHMASLFNPCHGNVLDGYFLSNNNNLHWTELVKNESNNVVISPKREIINGHSCLILKADLTCGHYTLWLEPNQQYTLRKAHIVLGPDNLYQDKPLKESSQRLLCYGPDNRRYYQTMEINLDDVKTKIIDGKVIPVEGLYTWRSTFDDEHQINSIKKISRHDIVFNPDFKALGAFEVNMPEGTVFTESLENGNYRKYIWSKGEMTPKK